MHETTVLDKRDEPRRLGAAAQALHDLVVRFTAEYSAVRQRSGEAVCPPPRSPFVCNPAPPISFHAYAVRLSSFLHCSSTALVVAHALLRRLFRDWGVLFEPSSHHKLLITACVLGAKWVDDLFYSNKYYAEVGGIAPATLGTLEREMLRLLDYCLFVSVPEFSDSLAVVGGERALVVGQFRHGHGPLAAPAPHALPRSPKRSRGDSDAHRHEAEQKRARSGMADEGEGEGEGEGDLSMLSPVSGLLNTDVVDGNSPGAALVGGGSAPVYRSLALAPAAVAAGVSRGAPPASALLSLGKPQWDDPLVSVSGLGACRPVEFAPLLCCARAGPSDAAPPSSLSLEH